MKREVADTNPGLSDKRACAVMSLVSGILARIGKDAFHQPK